MGAVAYVAYLKKVEHILQQTCEILDRTHFDIEEDFRHEMVERWKTYLNQ